MPPFPRIFFCILVVALSLWAGQCLAASATEAPGYGTEPSVVATPSRQSAVQLPPQLPPYLPNGAVNLEEAWIEDGGARLYWNTLLIPRQLKMSGATWVDPALTPQLLTPPPAATPPRKRWRSRRKAAPKPVTTATVPEGAGSTALICVPATPGMIPLPLTATDPKAAAPSTPVAPAVPAEPAKATPVAPAAPATPTNPAVQVPTETVPAPPLQ